MDKLTISEALQRLEDGAWHSVAYVAADVNREVGGRIVRIKECKLLRHDNMDVLPENLKNNSGNLSDQSDRRRRKQNHSRNATRNLRLRNGLTRKVHIYTLYSVDKIPVL